VYFTSGSTGIPKGVVGKNKSLTQFVQWEIEEFNIDRTFKVSQFISPYFDAFLRDVFVPLVAGATLVIPPNEDDFFTPSKMIDWIDDNEISLIHCVPSVFRVFSDKGIIKADMFSSLQYVLMSGEKIVPGELTFGMRLLKIASP
jgi:non-ribosomal peptide synthetase component F